MERQHFMPDNLVTWGDIVKGIAQVALETIVDISKQVRLDTPEDSYRGAEADLDAALYDQSQ